MNEKINGAAGSTTTKIGLEIFEAAILLGVLGDVLLRSVPLGLNVLLCMIVFVGAIIALKIRHGGQLDNKWFFAPLLVFAAFFAWRDSPVLMVLDTLAILLTLSLMTLQNQKIAVRFTGFVQYLYGTLAVFFNSALAPFFLIFGDIKWTKIPRKGWMKHAISALRGLAIAVPILVVFGALFMAADAMFDNIVRYTFNIQPEVLLVHGFMIGFFSWTTAGILRGLFLQRNFGEILESSGIFAGTSAPEAAAPAVTTAAEAPKHEEPKAQSYVDQVIHQSNEPKTDAPKAPKIEESVKEEKSKSPFQFLTIGLTEMTIVLGLMNVLFLSFVLVQIRYFFGGASTIQQITNLTYAEYARRGFFELVWVAALVLPILLIIHWLLRKNNPLNEKVFRYLAGGQIVLLFVIMSSALQRMFLYQNEYGLTELRVYTTAFMFWLAVVFVIFAATVLAGRRDRFAFAAYLSALVAIVALHFANPDLMITRVNIARLNEGKTFDANYASGLSADAIPALVEKMPEMKETNRCLLERNFLRRKDYESNRDWRSWNFSRQKAWNLVESNAENWNSENCPKPQEIYDGGF